MDNHSNKKTYFLHNPWLIQKVYSIVGGLPDRVTKAKMTLGSNPLPFEFKMSKIQVESNSQRQHITDPSLDWMTIQYLLLGIMYA